MKNFILIGILAFTSILLSGCGFTEGKKEAEAVLTRHFQAIEKNNFDTAMLNYGKQFFSNTTKKEWTKVLTKLNSKFGEYQRHTVTTWRVSKNASTSGTGTTVLLQCQVIYSKHPATESFTLFKGITDSDYKIIGHNINSLALLTE